MVGSHDRRLRWIEIAFFAVLWLGLIVVGRSAMFADPGTYWHIEVGRILDSTHEFITVDPFSFTRSGERWIAMQWLGEWGMFRVWDWLGLDGLLIVSVSILAWTYANVASGLLRAGCHWIVTASLLFFVLAASSHHFLVRPHLVSIALMAWTTRWLVRFETGERSVFLHPLVLFAVFVFWTNVHAGVLGGVVTVVAATIGWLIGRWLGWPIGIANGQRFGTAVFAAGVVVASIFINPYGVELPKVWLSLSSSQALPELIKEHARLDPTKTPDVYVVVVAAIFLAVLLGTPLRSWRVTWLLPILWLPMAFDRIRHAPLFAVVAMCVLPEMLGHCRWLLRLSNSGSDLFTPQKGTYYFFGKVVCPLLLAAAWGLLIFIRSDDKDVVASPNAKVAPVELLPAIGEHLGTEPRSIRVFNDLNFGGFVIHYLRSDYRWPGAKVFIDDRCELYQTSFLRSYCEARENYPKNLDHWLAQYKPQLAVVERHGGFDERLRGPLKWRLLAETPYAAAFAAPEQLPSNKNP